MKVAVTATAADLNAQVDPRFGRCACFVIVETDDLSHVAIDNTSQALAQGAGIQSARLLAEQGVQVVLTGHCGPNAFQTLEAAGIGVIVGVGGTVRGAVEQYQAGGLQPAHAPDVPGHTGSGAGAPPPNTPNVGGPAPGQPGMGRGAGRGQGGGQGGGMGAGQGRGRGRGCGGGGGGGGGMGRGRGGR